MPADIPYEVLEFTKTREMIAEAVNLSRNYNHIIGLFECDITNALKIIKDYNAKNEEKLSVTSWIMKCVAQAVAENKVIQTFRKGRRKMIKFEDVDIKCIVEKKIKERFVPLAYIVRKANEKSFKEINDEINLAKIYSKDKDKKDAKQKRKQKILRKLPKFVRDILWRRIIRDPFMIKKNLGTFGVTALGMFAKGVTGYAIPKSMHASSLAVGTISKKPWVVDDKLVIRDIVYLCCEFDHDVVDGAPAARFIRRITELVESAYDLDDFK